jgi:hypothetical protein
MREQSCYEILGVGEDASFDEIKQAKDRLVGECQGDQKQIELIEAAYDSVLMERLRMRQEGKIPVPDRIRFPERQVATPTAAPDNRPTSQATDWLQNFLDNPSRNDILWPGGAFLVTALVGVSAPPIGLALGIGVCIYFLNRKERKFGRSILLTFGGFFAGVVLGSLLGTLMAGQLSMLGLSADAFAMVITLVGLWLVSSFLR